MANEPLTLILGGARAGKSAYALSLAAGCERSSARRLCFIATAAALDDEMRARIARHQAERPQHWRTIEEPKQLDAALLKAADCEIVLVDCLTLFVSNVLLAAANARAGESEIKKITGSFLAIATESKQTIVCVSNEVGLGLVPDNTLGRAFRDTLGRVNQQFAQSAGRVYFLVAGLPLQIK